MKKNPNFKFSVKIFLEGFAKKKQLNFHSLVVSVSLLAFFFNLLLFNKNLRITPYNNSKTNYILI